MITLENCPVCGSKHIQNYHLVGTAPLVRHELMPAVILDAQIISRYFICQNCHVIFQNPRLSDVEIHRFYAKGYYRQTINMTDEEAANDEASRAKFDAKIIKNFIDQDILSHLDVGCGRGYLLEEIGAIVKVGVEVDKYRIKAESIEIYSRMSQVPQKSFDLVTAIHTLEHVPDPISYLKEMIKLVDKNGHLVIEVPTWKSPGGPLRLPHLFHFEPDVLKLMCREAGLKVLHVQFTPHLLLICKLDQV